ncbi:MAG: DUF177 domain-containing protein [Clostridiales bacterium]|nr:DUF177 domain-containing protein [Clostridiales bacterium]
MLDKVLSGRYNNLCDNRGEAMVFDLKPLFSGDVKQLPIDQKMDMRDLEWEGITPFSQPVHVTGAISVRADVVTLTIFCEAMYEGACDRCGAALSQPQDFSLERMLVPALDNAESEENEALLVVENMRLDLEEFVRSEVILHMPMKHLCKEECLGICPVCGRNRNEGLCGCDTKEIDPRLSALQDLLH